jgi:eukaryotic-like serine/threonine-protein kinase
MAQIIACPDPLHLRLFFNQRANPPESELLRAHVKQCEACRAIVAELDDIEDNDDTLADDTSPDHRPTSPTAETPASYPPYAFVAVRELGGGHRTKVANPSVVLDGPMEASEDSTVILPPRIIAAECAAWEKSARLRPDQAESPVQHLQSSTDTSVILLKNNAVGQPELGDDSQKTFADFPFVSEGPVKSSAETTVILPPNKAAAQPDPADESLQTIVDLAADPGWPMAPETEKRARPDTTGRGNSAINTIVMAPGETAGNGGSLGFSDSMPDEARGRNFDSAVTFVMEGDNDPGRISRLGTPKSPERADAKRESISSAARLQAVSVPGYDILEELGRGGMGVVYKARHRRLQRLVALKMVLAGAHVGQVGLARFRAEAEAVAKLLHSNIVQIYETGEHEGRPYFSLEYVDGGSLDQRIRESPTSPRAAAQLVETLARTMDVAHQRGIVHRDLKPANILLAEIGSQSSLVRGRDLDSSSLPSNHWSRNTIPKIADFGLAKRVDGDSSQTQSGTILGTPSYMAPEQAGGKNREIGPAADIYSLGAILYELLVGRPPFKAGNPIDTVRQVIEQEPVPPRQLEPRVPHDLQTICLKCLEKDPSHRFPTAADLADDLRRFVEGEPIHARPTPAWERAWKWGKRRPEIVALMSLGVLSLVGGLLFFAWHNVSLSTKLAVALKDERAARQREEEAVEEQTIAELRVKGQELFHTARLADAASDWTGARVNLEKALATVDRHARLTDLKESSQQLLDQVEQKLRIETDRRKSQTALQKFMKARDEAQFLGTLYTGMDLAANLEAVRIAVEQALAVYGVLSETAAPPRLDAYLTDSQKAEILGDCYQLLLILAETEAQSVSDRKPPEKEIHLKKALSLLEKAKGFGSPSRAFHLRRARYLSLLGDEAEATRADKAAQGAALDRVLDHFLMGDELYRREKLGDAVKEFDQVLDGKPGHFWAQYLNAICLLRSGRPAEARAHLSACLAQRSDFVWLYLMRGFAQEELQAWAAADSDFQKASLLPLDENARYMLLVHRGVLRIRQERLTDAVADLKSAIERKPTAYQAYVNLAHALRQLHMLDQALEQLNRAVALEPGLAQLYRLRARLNLERNEPTLALKDFDRAIEREHTSSPSRIDDLIERGRLLLGAEKYAEALGSFDAALALEKDQPLAQRMRAEALFRLHRFAEVIEAFDSYLQKGKPLESVYRGRGLARAELGQYPGAIEDFTKALELHPTPAVQAYRGWTHLVVDAPKLALRDFDLAIALDSKSGDAFNGRGYARARLGQHREAVQDAAEALRLGPPSPRLFYNAARIHAQCPGRGPQRALELIQQALNSLPEDQRPAFWLAHIRSDAAMAALRRYPMFGHLDAELSHRE